MYYLIKSDRTGLVAKKVPVKGKTKVYQAIRYVSLQNTKKRVQQFVKERERQSKHTRYMKKHPENVDVITQAEMKEHITANEKGQRYFYGVNVDLIDKAVMTLDPDKAEGLIGMIVKNDGTKPVMKYSDNRLEKNAKKKHIRAKRLGENVGKLREDYERWMKGGGAKQQVGACLALMDKHEIRVGGAKNARTDHFGSTTLQAGHVVRIKTEEDAKRLSSKMLSDRLQPVIDTEQKAKDEQDPVKKGKLIERAKKNREKVESSVAAMPKPKVGQVWLDFTGKSSVQWTLEVDPVVKDTLLKLSEGKKPNERLFSIDRTDVAKTLKKYRVIPKDFRTYHATKAFAEEAEKIIGELGNPKNQKELKSIMKNLFERVSMRLWNKPGVCKKAYVDPAAAAHFEMKMLEKIQLTKSVKYVVLKSKDLPYTDILKSRTLGAQDLSPRKKRFVVNDVVKRNTFQGHPYHRGEVSQVLEHPDPENSMVKVKWANGEHEWHRARFLDEHKG